jgi:phenylacetate-CoA ligase
MRTFRDRKLRELVRHAYDHVPFYRQLLDEHGVRPGSIEGMQDLPRLPILTKEMFHAHWSDLRAVTITDGSVSVSQTGGTTGVPMKIARDGPGTAWGLACYIRGLGWGGLTLRERRVRLFGGTLGVQPARRFDGLRNWFSGTVFVPAFELNAQNVVTYAKMIRESGAVFLIGYASACYALATLTEAAGERLSFRAVFPTAELCPDSWAEAIGRVFSARVLPYYGCGEVNSIAYSCPENRVYHTCDEHVVLEVEGDTGKTAEVGEGAFLVTDLDNRAMPVIRYRNGDAGVLAAPGCRCGRQLGRILRLDGRVNDMLITTGGAKVSGVIGTHTFRLIDDVEAYQLVQRTPGQVEVRIVRRSGYNPTVQEPKILGILRRHLGAGATVTIEYVTAIPKTAAGKARFVINEFLASRES